ncbi:MAG: serine/threonine-protein kinase [Planctomycetota bacterium]|jgi:serine/threonine protein kinase|nr:serine/threonine-protein kinase [Planctomycetota bacterium]
MADSIGPLDAEKRRDLEALLEVRARLLQPQASLIDRALRRCARYDQRAGRDRFAGTVGNRTTGTTAAVDAAHDAAEESMASLGPLTDFGAEVDILAERASSPSGSAEAAVGTGSGSQATPVPEEVAAAATVPEEDASEVERQLAADPPPLPKLLPGGVFEVGTEIAGYRIEGRLGRGGMGDVYRATQLSMGRQVAFKVLAKKLADDEVFRARFLREARSAGRLQHPNLIAVHDVGEISGLLFFSMEMVKGKSVGDQLKGEGIFAEDDAIEVMRQVLEALKYAHAHGLVHRDIKPDNIMVTERDMVKVADLGLARQVDDGEGSRAGNDQTKSGTMMGTPYYMPPEQGQDARYATARSDIYAVGATLYHMVVGTVPFKGRTPVEVVVNATTKPLRFPEGKGSPKLRRLVARFMAKDPDDRPADAEEALMMLERLQHGGAAPVAGSTSGRFGERSSYMRARYDGRQGLRLWLGIGVVVLLLLIGTLVLLDRISSANTWNTFVEFLDKDVDKHRYRDALERINAFQAAHASMYREAEQRREGVIENWDEFALEVLRLPMNEVDIHLRQGNYRDAARVIELGARDASLQSPRAEELLGARRKEVLGQQDLAIQALEEDVTALLASNAFAQGSAQVMGVGRVTPDRHEEILALQKMVDDAWDGAISDVAQRQLDEARNLMRSGDYDGAEGTLRALKGQEALLAPAVLDQISSMEMRLGRRHQDNYRFNPTAWFREAQQLRPGGSKPEALEDGRFRFMGLGAVRVLEDPEMPAGLHLMFDLEVIGDVEWRIGFGRLREGRIITVTKDRVALAEMNGLRGRGRSGGGAGAGGPRIELVGNELASQPHSGGLRIEMIWYKDEVEVRVAGMKLEPQRIKRSEGGSAFFIHWNNTGSVIARPHTGQ